MPRLYEYQGKRLIEDAIAIAPSELVDNPTEAQTAASRIGYPVMIKAQLLSGRRGKLGLVKKANDADEVKTTATEMLGKVVKGVKIEKLLVERFLDVTAEMYISILPDPSRRKPVVMFCTEGGMEIEEIVQQFKEKLGMCYVDVLKGLEDFRARELLRKLGICGRDLLALSDILVKLYQKYRRFECKLLEINPLVKTADGAFHAADARIDIDDDAVGRHPELPFSMHEDVGERPPTALELIGNKIDEGDLRGTSHFVQIDPELNHCREIGAVPIGFDGVGTGASLTQMDEIVPLGYFPINFCDTSGNPPASKLYRITKIIFSQRGMEGYLLTCCVSSQQLENTARGIIKALKELYPKTNGKPSIPCVFMFSGAFAGEAVDEFRMAGIDQSPWVSVLGGDVTAKDAAVALDRCYKIWKLKKGEQRQEDEQKKPVRRHTDYGGEILEFGTYSGGTIRIDLQKCMECADKPCLEIDCRYGKILKVDKERIALAKDREAISRGACVECLGCEFVCQRIGRNAITITLPTPELDTFLADAKYETVYRS